MKKVKISLLISVAVLLSAVALKSLEPAFIVDFQNRTFDLYQRLHPREYEPVPVRIVDIDDESLSRIGQWPWPRTLLARLVDRLNGAGVAAIGFDIVFAEPDRTSPKQMMELWRREGVWKQELRALPDHDELFAQSVSKAPVATGFVLTQGQTGLPAVKSGFSFAGENPAAFALPFRGAVVSLPLLEQAAKGNGALNNQPDRDGILRRIPLVMRAGDKLYPSLGGEALRIAQGAKGYLVKTVGASGEEGTSHGITDVKIGNVVIPTDSRGNQWVYFSPSVDERYVPAWQVLEGKADTSKLEGNIVFVGTSAAGLKDIRATPLNPVIPGVEVFVQSLEQALLGITIERPDWIRGAEILLMAAAGLMLLVMNQFLNPLWGALCMAAMFSGTAYVSWYAFTVQRVLVEPVMPCIAVALVYFSDALMRYIRTERERNHIRNAFSQYMSPDLVRELAHQPEKLTLGGESRTLSIMFCDVRNFTSISENLSPMALTQLMSRFLTPMTEVILAHQGTIDKYIGDCIMAFWNAPLKDDNHAQHAAQSALHMRSALHDLNAAREAEAHSNGEAFFPIQTGIGINTGECCVGNMGTPQRFNYSALGDEVNLTSRLEGQCKYYGVDIVLGEGTARQLPDMALLELDRIRVKGKKNTVRIYTLLGDAAMASDPAFIALARHHSAMLEAYRAQEWDRAEQSLAQCRETAESMQPPLAGLYARFAERIARFRKAPPGKDWDGVYEATEKG